MYIGMQPSQLSGLGAKQTAAQRQAHRLAMQNVRVAGRAAKAHPRDVQNGSVAHLNAIVSALGQQTSQLVARAKAARTPAQKRALYPVALAHLQSLGQNLSPSMMKTAVAPLSAAAARARRATARTQRRLRGMSGLGDILEGFVDALGSLGCDPTNPDPNDPSCQQDPNAGGGIPSDIPPGAPPYPMTPGTTGSGAFDPMSMLSMLPGLMSNAGGSGVTCTNPNLPRCIIAQQAAQTQQNMMFIFSILMNMFQQMMQVMQTLQTSAQQQPPYGYGQQPYTPPYGMDPSQQYGQYGQGMQPQMQSPYAMPNPSGDSSQLPAGYDTGGQAADMFSSGPPQDASPVQDVSVTSPAPGYSPSSALPPQVPIAPLTFDPGGGLPISSVNVAPDAEPSPSPQFPNIIIQMPGSGGSDPNISPEMLLANRRMVQPENLQLGPAPAQMESENEFAANNSGDDWN